MSISLVNMRTSTIPEYATIESILDLSYLSALGNKTFPPNVSPFEISLMINIESRKFGLNCLTLLI